MVLLLILVQVQDLTAARQVSLVVLPALLVQVLVLLVMVALQPSMAPSVAMVLQQALEALVELLTYSQVLVGLMVVQVVA